MLKYKLYSIFILILVILPAAEGRGGDDTFDPWKFGGRAVSENVSSSAAHTAKPSLPARVALGSLRFFSEYISKVDGDRCPMYPTCAAYSRQAFKKHGFFVGIVMTVDRLIHESNEMEYAPRVKVYGRMRFYDPVSWNDYWWYRTEGLDK